MACAGSLRGALEPKALSFSTPRTMPLSRRVSRALQKAWRNYWRRRANRATLFILRSLDDRTLEDIGIDRGEIESVVCGGEERRICLAPCSR